MTDAAAARRPKLRVRILGCGSSGGVPRVGGLWGACDPAEPLNRRRRCSILITQGEDEAATRILVDTSPDLREQLLDADVTRLDGVVITHEHADHTHGIDDLRPLAIAMRRKLDLYADARTGALLRDRFGYCFASPAGSSYPPILREHRIAAGESFTISGAGGDVTLKPFRLVHGDIDALGLRVRGVAYTPDVNAIPDEALGDLTGLDIWIIDALRHTAHPTHFTLDEALSWVARQRPLRAVLTNMHTDLDYRTLERELPQGIVPAYDGLELEV